jgi:hypothetical protein
LIDGAVKAFVHAGAVDLGEARAALLEQRDGVLIVGGFLYDPVVEDKAVLVFAHGYTQPQLDRYAASLAFADPLGVGLEEAGKTFSAWGMR